MSAVLLAPHADDETLFAAYLAMTYHPRVVCVYDEGRMHELSAAVGYLGCEYNMLPLVRKGEGPEAIVRELSRPHLFTGEPEVIIAPLWREEGHLEHNWVALAAEERWPDKKIVRYLTYGPRGERDREGTEWTPAAGQVARKLRALSCYTSQIEDPVTRPWFFNLLDLREWVSV